MTFPNTHIYLRANGAFGTSTGAEKWSVGFRFGIFGQDVGYSLTNLQTFVSTAAAAVTSFHTSTNAKVGTVCFFTHCTAARIGVNGKYDPSGQDTLFSAPQASVGNATAMNPWSTAHVISLRTNRPRGVASNGRIYYPALSLPIVPATGRVGNSDVIARVTAAKTLINSLNTAADTYESGMRLMVMSNLNFGLAATVTSIRADERLDAIERRENSAVAVWQTATIP